MSFSKSTDPALPGDAPYRVAVVTLGCPKNQVDSERIMALLAAEGFRLVDDPEDADGVVINTCAFIEDALRESIDEILDLARLKEHGRLRHLVVAGCLAERYGRELLRELPEVDALVGPGNVSRAAQTLRDLVRGGRRPVHVGSFEPVDRVEHRLRVGAPHSAYVKIAEGCDHRCAFCLIPRLRGPMRSRSPGAIVREVEELAAEGVREVVLIAQDTTAYGRDLAGRPSLADLLGRLERCAGPEWMRLLYTHPRHFDDALIERLAAGGRLLPYVDVPIQHVSDPVLAAMRRGHGARRVRELIGTLRRRVPGVVLRTTVITGHPGEGEREFAELLGFLREFPFDRLGAFAYSPEVDLPSASPASAASRPVAEERRRQVLELQRELAVTSQQNRKGTTLDVLIEGVDPDKGYAIGRSYGEAPEIDGWVYVKDALRSVGGDLDPGVFLSVRIIGAGPYDLVGVPAAQRTGARNDA